MTFQRKASQIQMLHYFISKSQCKITLRFLWGSWSWGLVLPCIHIIYEFDLSSPVPSSILIYLVAARRLDVYEEECDTAGCSTTLRSRCSRKSLSCRSLSCNRSSVSLNTLSAESDDEQLPSPSHARTGAFSSRVVRHSHTFCLSPSCLTARGGEHPGKLISRIRLF